MRSRASAVVFVGALLFCSQAAHAECSRGATCLGRWRKPQSSETKTGAQPRVAPAETPLVEPPPRLPATPPLQAAPAARDPSTRHYPPGPRHWYGWQLLIIDSAVVVPAAILDGAHVRGDGVTALGFSLGLVFDIAPPVVHAFHHRSRIAWASFGVRSTLPFTILLSTLLIQPCRGILEARCVNSVVANASAYVGLAAASAIDVSLFAWDAPTNHEPSRAAVEWSPLVAPRPDGATVGVRGAF